MVFDALVVVVGMHSITLLLLSGFKKCSAQKPTLPKRNWWWTTSIFTLLGPGSENPRRKEPLGHRYRRLVTFILVIILLL